MRPSSFFYLHRSDRRVLLAFLLVAVLFLCMLFVTGGNEEGEAVVEADSSQRGMIHSVNGQIAKNAHSSSAASGQTEVYRPERFPFDPNTADSFQLRRLGLQSWQIRNIYKYRAAGGIYREKIDFARTYGLTQKEYRELEPFIQISSDYQPAALLVQERKLQKEESQIKISILIY